MRGWITLYNRKMKGTPNSNPRTSKKQVKNTKTAIKASEKTPESSMPSLKRVF
jgi:hypothetical protein